MCNGDNHSEVMKDADEALKRTYVSDAGQHSNTSNDRRKTPPELENDKKKDSKDGGKGKNGDGKGGDKDGENDDGKGNNKDDKNKATFLRSTSYLLEHPETFCTYLKMKLKRHH